MNGTAWFYCQLHATKTQHFTNSYTSVLQWSVLLFLLCVGGACILGKVFQHDLCCEVKYDFV